mmetsp:Transcript_34186/g.86449  ORF Transcript_34186/g.86449 Transcript_34186/m.86449 type:complete len:210 (-) Transcript_34186:228-857(-)
MGVCVISSPAPGHMAAASSRAPWKHRQLEESILGTSLPSHSDVSKPLAIPNKGASLDSWCTRYKAEQYCPEDLDLGGMMDMVLLNSPPGRMKTSSANHSFLSSVSTLTPHGSRSHSIDQPSAMPFEFDDEPADAPAAHLAPAKPEAHETAETPAVYRRRATRRMRTKAGSLAEKPQSSFAWDGGAEAGAGAVTRLRCASPYAFSDLVLE